MFTGLIYHVVQLISLNHSDQGSFLEVELVGTPFQNLNLGGSIALNGVCLTLDKQFITDIGRWRGIFFVLKETLERTALLSYSVGDHLNLELALLLTDRLGGHLLQGHVDAVAEIQSLSVMKNGDRLLTIAYPFDDAPYLILKGSVALDGISLTVANLSEDICTCAIIPRTFFETNLCRKKVGDKVNLEYDIVGKYLHRFYVLGVKRDD